jgi:sterol desaturase/sphingolipid hydroxylase (fatty acid hydroxylase superfamily)
MDSLILLALAPVFLGFIAWEAWQFKRIGRVSYTWADTASNAALALMHQASDALAWLLTFGIFVWLWKHRLFNIPAAWWSVVLLVVAQDFFYYWFHRTSHRVRWLWASHVTHHSSERLNLSTAFRQSLTYPISGMWLFWLPLAFIGFAPAHIVTVVAINLAFQFFVHTEAVGKLGWLEAVFNTPSHHRVHHARNPQYLDRNYAGVFIVWDKLFGSFTPEDPADPCVYGITHPVRSHNPITLTFHEWAAMLRDAGRARGLRARLVQLFGPPDRALAGQAAETELPQSAKPSHSR